MLLESPLEFRPAPGRVVGTGQPGSVGSGYRNRAGRVPGTVTVEAHGVSRTPKGPSVWDTRIMQNGQTVYSFTFESFSESFTTPVPIQRLLNLHQNVVVLWTKVGPLLLHDKSNTVPHPRRDLLSPTVRRGSPVVPPFLSSFVYLSLSSTRPGHS